MITLDELCNKPIKDITADDLQKLVISDSDRFHIKRSHFTIVINGKTMERCILGRWYVEFERMGNAVFYFDDFFDMPKALQDLWKQKADQYDGRSI